MFEFSSKLDALLAFNRITLGYPVLATQLLQGYESAAEFFAGFSADNIQLPPKLSSQLLNPNTQVIMRGIEADKKWLLAPKHHICSIFDKDYPSLLRQIDDPPVCLFCNGDVSVLQKNHMAVVGSRKPTASGIKIAKQFSNSLAMKGFVVVSGMAFGVDAAAHTGSLLGNGETIAVLGSGVDVIYPRSHERLALRIRDQGLLVSEFPIGTKPHSRFFPQRNRIVTGLSMGTIVVEAATKSGSLISARLAMEQNREVFAVPGSIFNTQSMGCHELIKQGAKLTTCVDDILEELPGFGRQTGIRVLPSMTVDAAAIFEQLDGSPVSLDKLHELTHLSVPTLLANLLKLELDGIVLMQANGYALALK